LSNFDQTLADILADTHESQADQRKKESRRANGGKLLLSGPLRIVEDWFVAQACGREARRALEP